MPDQKRDEERQGYNHEKWQGSDPGRVPGMRHQIIQNWKRIKLYISLQMTKRLVLNQPLLFIAHSERL
jgi:hypothetical protein